MLASIMRSRLITETVEEGVEVGFDQARFEEVVQGTAVEFELGERDGPELAGPVVDVLEDVAVEGAQVAGVEIARDRNKVQLGHPQCRCAGL